MIGIRIAFILFISTNLNAQSISFITNGVIEYDKTVNMYAVLPRIVTGNNIPQIIEDYKKSQPQFLVMKSVLSFSNNKTFFEPLSNTSPNYYNNNPAVTQSNTIYTDLSLRHSITQKAVFDELFLVRDSTRIIKWKITDQTRDIAGFPCRRANAIIMDSIYVVAFYTSDIPVPGGPESFTGLPGMILQIVIPHENVSWIATKVTSKVVLPLMPPSNGKVVTYRELRDSLKTGLQRLGKTAQAYLKAVLL